MSVATPRGILNEWVMSLHTPRKRLEYFERYNTYDTYDGHNSAGGPDWYALHLP